MPETLPPTGITNVGDPRLEKPLALKPYSQWRQESGVESEIDGLFGYSNYQRLQALKAGQYTADTEKQIQSALLGQVQKRGLLDGKTEEEQDQFLGSLFDVPEPSFDESVRAVNAAYPSATVDSDDPDIANFARFRDIGKSLGDEVGQEDQARFDEAKQEATKSVAALYDRAQRDRVRSGDIPIAIVTNYDEKGEPYRDFYAGDIGDMPANEAVAKAVESGAVPPQAAFAAYSALEKVPGLGVNMIQERNIRRVKNLASKASTIDQYTGIQDIINDYGDYLVDKEKGKTDEEDESFARQTEARFATYLDMLTEDSEEQPTKSAVSQALEE